METFRVCNKCVKGTLKQKVDANEKTSHLQAIFTHPISQWHLRQEIRQIFAIRLSLGGFGVFGGGVAKSLRRQGWVRGLGGGGGILSGRYTWFIPNQCFDHWESTPRLPSSGITETVGCCRLSSAANCKFCRNYPQHHLQIQLLQIISMLIIGVPPLALTPGSEDLLINVWPNST